MGWFVYCINCWCVVECVVILFWWIGDVWGGCGLWWFDLLCFVGVIDSWVFYVVGYGGMYFGIIYVGGWSMCVVVYLFCCLWWFGGWFWYMVCVLFVVLCVVDVDFVCIVWVGDLYVYWLYYWFVVCVCGSDVV